MAASNNAQMQALQQQSTTNSMLNQLPQQQRSQIETAVNSYRQTLTSQGYQSEVIQTYVWNYYTQCVTTLFQEHSKSAGSADSSATQVPSSSSSSPPPAPSGDAMPVPSQAQPSAEADQGVGMQAQQTIAQQMQQRQAQLQQQRQQFQQRAQQQQLQMQFHQQQQQQQSQSAGPQVIRPHFSMQNSMMGGQMPSSGVKVAPSVAPSLATSEQQLEDMDTSSPSKPSGNSWNSSSNGGDWKSSSNGGDWKGNSNGSDWKGNSNGGDWKGNWNSSDWNSKSNSSGWNSNSNAGDSGGAQGMSSFSQPSMGSSGSNNFLSAKAAQVAQNINAVNSASADRALSLSMLGSTPKSAPAKASTAAWARPQGIAMNPAMAMSQGMAMNQAAAGMSNSGVRFPMMVGRPPAGQMRPNTPKFGMQMQQAQMGNSMGAGGWQVRAGFGAPGRPKAIPGKAPPAAFGGAPGRPGGPQFPPALQKWLQRLFAHQQQSPENDDKLQKATHTYLRHWVQQWVKTGELWQRSWDTAPLPTPEEIRGNLPPGTLGGANAMGVMAGITVPPPPAAQLPGALGRPTGPRVIEPPAWGNKNANAMANSGDNSQAGFSGPGGMNKRPDFNRRRRSRSRRRRRRSSSSSNSSRSKSGRSRSRKRKDGEDSSGSEADATASKGKGKAGKLGKDLSRVPQEEARQQVRKLIDERLQNGVRNYKEIQGELQRTFGVNNKKFRSMFNQTLQEYCYNFQVKAGFIPAGGLEGGIRPPKVVSQGEQEMRAQRAARFQTHLQVERTQVAMVSFNDGVEASVAGGPLVGALSDMCSREEAREREMTRQLDKMEWKKGTDPKNPEVNLALATKKYQRSSADKAYRSQDVRTLDACWRTMEFLMTEILDFDKNPKPQFAVQNMPYIEVYSYLRDRTRSCRVDLHLQQPRSTTEKTFVETHEVCLRFEMLSLFLLQGEVRAGGSTEKYDEKLGLKAISQTIEPLLNSYQAVRDKLLAKSILAEAMGGLLDADEPDGEEYTSAFEAAVHRYIILLLMAFSPEELLTHLAKLSQEILSHPLVGFATKAFAAFQTDDYGAFLRLYRTADFLTAIAMSGVADLARLRALWLLVRTYCQPVGDKLPMKRIQNLLAFASESHARSFLAFHGVKVDTDGKGGEPFVVLPKKGTPEAAQHPLLTGPNRLPEKCEYPKGADSMLVSKFEALGLSRAEIVFGSADPIVEVVEPEVEAVEEGEPTCESTDPPAVPAEAPDAEVAAEIAKDA